VVAHYVADVEFFGSPRRGEARRAWLLLILVKVPIGPRAQHHAEGSSQKENTMGKLVVVAATVVSAVVLSASPVSVKWSAEKNLSVSQDKAFAIVGRPGTPRSVAGVARRTERRAIRRGY